MNIKKILVYMVIVLFSYNLYAQEGKNAEDKSILILFSGSHDFLVNRQMFLTFERALKPNNIRVYC